MTALVVLHEGSAAGNCRRITQRRAKGQVSIFQIHVDTPDPPVWRYYIDNEEEMWSSHPMDEFL